MFEQPKRRILKKKEREEIHQKYNGRCAYCGGKINYGEMQVDHFWPITMSHWEPGKDPNRFENLKPACRKCNHYKSSNRPEDFRKELNRIYGRLIGKAFTIVKLAINYGFLERRKPEIKFFFEMVETVGIEKAETWHMQTRKEFIKNEYIK